MVRDQSQSLAVLSNGLVYSALLYPSVAEVDVGAGVLLVDPSGLPELGDGFVHPPLGPQSDAQVIVCIGVIGPESDGFAERGLRFAVLVKAVI